MTNDQDYDLLTAIVDAIDDPDFYVEDLGHCNYSIVSKKDIAAAEDHEFVGVTNFNGSMYADTIDGAHPTDGPDVDAPLDELVVWVKNTHHDVVKAAAAEKAAT